ncbi:hypothetical protein [Paenibacillus lutrae]|uniref:Uncharacterized protein n=1 Tax=Paenibacillus lutrae TaxID=2078573 RepID=A0A7X3K137_9BACL|nr:hypothetical protein [Paenibacillus lutrae]MVP01705.1 hypothetical protein [Paenibacillus lutrae]
MTENKNESSVPGESSSALPDSGEAQPPHPHQPWKGSQVAVGIGWVAACHLIWLIAAPLYLGIGIVQLVYVIPLLIISHVKGKTGVFQGILIAAGITFLINAACFGYVYINFSTLH